jgi:membrane associated rhomboid family serine protease
VFQLQVTPTSFWITLFSSTFIHTRCAHIFGNMLFLFVVGLHVERWIGWFSPISPLSDLRLGVNAFEIATAVGSNVSEFGASGAIAGSWPLIWGSIRRTTSGR